MRFTRFELAAEYVTFISYERAGGGILGALHQVRRAVNADLARPVYAEDRFQIRRWKLKRLDWGIHIFVIAEPVTIQDAA